MFDRLKQIGRALIRLVKKPLVDKNRPKDTLDIRIVRNNPVGATKTNCHVRKAWLEDGGGH